MYGPNCFYYHANLWHTSEGLCTDSPNLLVAVVTWWPWHSIFKVKFLNGCISGMGCPIGKKPKWYELNQCWTFYMTLTFDLSMTLILDFQGQFSNCISGRGCLLGMKWNDLWSHPWFWPWIFKDRYRNSCISGMDGSCFIWNICADVKEND